MGPSNRDFCSPDPLDHKTDPLDQANKKRSFEGEENDWVPTLDIRALRTKLKLTQREFAGWFGLPVATLRHWVRGNRQPVGPALVLLHVIWANPRVVRDAVRKARNRNPGTLAAIETTLTPRRRRIAV